jgi:hypothetical protein
MVKEGEEMGCSCSGACMRERERGEDEGVMAAVVREKERKRYGCYFLHGCMQLKVE